MRTATLGLALGLVAVLALWGAAMAGLLLAARLEPGAQGRATAVFPPGWGRERQLAAVLAAGATPMRDTWLPGVTQVRLDGNEAVARLKASGAVLLLPAVPFEALGMGGCSWQVPPGRQMSPLETKLRVGPL